MQFVDKLRSIQDTIAHAVRFAKHLDDCPTGSEHEHEHEQEYEYEYEQEQEQEQERKKVRNAWLRQESR